MFDLYIFGDAQFMYSCLCFTYSLLLNKMFHESALPHALTPYQSNFSDVHIQQVLNKYLLYEQMLSISEALWGLFLNNKGAHKEYRFETRFECKLSICFQVSDFDLLQADRLQSKQAGQCIFSCRKGCKRGNEKEEVRLGFSSWLHGLPSITN